MFVWLFFPLQIWALILFIQSVLADWWLFLLTLTAYLLLLVQFLTYLSYLLLYGHLLRWWGNLVAGRTMFLQGSRTTQDGFLGTIDSGRLNLLLFWRRCYLEIWRSDISMFFWTGSNLLLCLSPSFLHFHLNLLLSSLFNKICQRHLCRNLFFGPRIHLLPSGTWSLFESWHFLIIKIALESLLQGVLLQLFNKTLIRVNLSKGSFYLAAFAL